MMFEGKIAKNKLSKSAHKTQKKNAQQGREKATKQPPQGKQNKNRFTATQK